MRILHVGHVPFQPESGTPYHLSMALARHIPVTYLNPPMSLSRWLQTYRWRVQRSQSAHIDVLSVVLPGELRFLPRRLRTKPQQILTLASILQRLRRIVSGAWVLWVSNSDLAPVLHRLLRPVLTCYHRLDDFGAMDPSLINLECELEKISDIIFVVSPHLQAQHVQRGRHAILLPNAVDIASFAKALDEATFVPTDLGNLPAPRIGFVGWVTPRWIDIDLVLEIARRRSNWSFVLIGPKVSWHPSALPPNVYLLGKRPYHLLPHYLKGLDVCLVPFKNNAITHGASPLKLYEYLAAGRAVVSTPVPDLPAFEGVVWCAEDAPNFIRAIEEALTVAHDPQEQRRRVEAVAPHSWEARAQTVLEYLGRAVQSGSALASPYPLPPVPR
jgi:glycosyltransferase involved in cell wall biosynthesis